MNKFEKQLEKWNNGVLRGAQAQLAKTLKVSSAIVALWTTGKRRPSKGYADKMASLFNIEVYAVMRLFDGLSTTYPEPVRAPARTTLREKNNAPYQANARLEAEANIPSAQSNSVSLPFLARIPQDTATTYPEEDVVEWWTLPRRAAKGAKYLIHRPANGIHQQADDLYFIKPCNQPQPDALLLVQTDQQTLFARIQVQGSNWQLSSEDGLDRQTLPSEKLRVLGLVVRKIIDML